MFTEITTVQIFTGCLLNELRGGKAAAVLPDILA
ncbi:Uncharacterised protein [Lelliottia amnigena]|nr:Uncharacterised protein [Lelliottia amnigena]